MFDITKYIEDTKDIEDTKYTEDTIIDTEDLFKNTEIDLNNPKYRYLIYLGLLEKKLIPYGYLSDKYLDYITLNNLKVLDRYMLCVKNRNNIYTIDDCMIITDALKFKKILEKNILNNDMYDKDNKIKIKNADNCCEKLVLNSVKKIKFLGYSKIKYLYETISNNEYSLRSCIVNNYYFEIIDDSELKYIYYSNFSYEFYKLVDYPNIEYYPSDNCELYIHYDYKGNNILSDNKDEQTYIENKYFTYSYHKYPIYIKPTQIENYKKTTHTKAIFV